ncbi:transposase [Providencia sp. PROV104]|uniref:transposase n=1 Tax=Providencia sp. PROV104 TaxID=2949816 RepID=UPI00234AB563|nr:transposase [Providencia sp. PROV104]
MSFWKKVGTLAKSGAVSVFNEAVAFNDRHQKMKNQSDDELTGITQDNGYFSSTTEAEKRLAKSILRQRQK